MSALPWRRCRFTSGRCGSEPPWCNRSRGKVTEQIGDGDRLIAVWAGSAGTQPSAKDAAVVTPLLAEQAGFACGALVDDHRGGQSARQVKAPFVSRSLTTTEFTLAAGVGAVPPAATRGKGALAHGAHALAVRSVAIVTQRGGPRSVVGGDAWKHPSTSAGGRDGPDGPGSRQRVSGRHWPGRDARLRAAAG